MKKEMSVQEIRAQFNCEWVLIGDPQTDDTLEVVRGKVLHHGKDRDEVYRAAAAKRPKRSAILYTGQMPDDTAMVL
jgi:hypothetical protein